MINLLPFFAFAFTAINPFAFQPLLFPSVELKKLATLPIASAGSNGNGALFEFDVPTGYYAINTKNLNTYG